MTVLEFHEVARAAAEKAAISIARDIACRVGVSIVYDWRERGWWLLPGIHCDALEGNQWAANTDEVLWSAQAAYKELNPI